MPAPIRVLVSGSGKMGRAIIDAIAADDRLDLAGALLHDQESAMATPIRVLVSGSGKMGRAIIDAIAADDSVEPVGAVDKLDAADDLPLPGGAHIPLFHDTTTAFAAAKPDVVIDFTNAAWTPIVAQAALDHGTRMVIGTTGLPEAFIAQLGRDCRERKVGAVIAANFALGGILMMHLAKIAARFFDSAEIIELHHDQKVDAPSGTSIATAHAMIEGRDGKPFARNVPETQTIEGSRAAAYDGITIHSVRLPGLVAHQEVLFGGTGQTLSIRHDSIGRDSFMPGILLATREVMRRDDLVIGLDALIGLV
jgi:4-hydroxy-tetrahydrodipicolinate reductase